MRISPINNVYVNNNRSFGAKPSQKAISKIANKALLPTAVCAYILSPLMGMSTPRTENKEYPQVQYQKEFVMDNKKYTMTYVNTNESFGKNAVSEIYFIPEDKNERNLRLESMLKYVSGEDYDINVTVSTMGTDSIKEIELPQKVGKELLKLYDGKTKFFIIPGFNTYTEVNTDYFM